MAAEERYLLFFQTKPTVAQKTTDSLGIKARKTPSTQKDYDRKRLKGRLISAIKTSEELTNSATFLLSTYLFLVSFTSQHAKTAVLFVCALGVLGDFRKNSLFYNNRIA